MVPSSRVKRMLDLWRQHQQSLHKRRQLSIISVFQANKQKTSFYTSVTKHKTHINKICFIIYSHSPTRFDRFCDHHQGVVQKYKQNKNIPDFKLFAVFWMLYAFFWVIPRRLNFICRRFETLCLFHLHKRIGIKDDYVWKCWSTYTGKGLARK